MRGAFIIGFLFFLSYNSKGQCGFALRDKVLEEIGGATYIKDFRVSLPQGNTKKPPKEEFGILLNRGTHYRFNIKSDSSCTDQVMLRLYDYDKFYGGNYDPDDGSLYTFFDFFCSKTQIYYLSISFEDAGKGCAAAVVSYVENFKSE
jgi:hypothetical protein